MNKATEDSKDPSKALLLFVLLVALRDAEERRNALTTLPDTTLMDEEDKCGEVEGGED